MKPVKTLIAPLLFAALLAVATFALAISAGAESDCPQRGEISTFGDANGDGVVDILDLAHLAAYIANYDEATGTSSVRLGPEKFGHDFNCQDTSDKYLASPAACTEPAYYYYSCACGERGKETFAYGEPLGHDYVKTVTPPTCTERGYTTHTCSRCGDSYIDSYVEATGHRFTEQVVADEYLAAPATCTEPARYYYSCECGERDEETFAWGDPLGHNYIDHTCTNCGACQPSEGLAFASNPDGTCFISGLGSCTDKYVLIPSVSPAGDAVTGIAAYAFYNNPSVLGVTIPVGVTSIGNSAFSYCTALEHVTIPEGVTSVGDYAFYCCFSLESVTIPAGVASIGDYAFCYCGELEHVTIREGITSIGEYAFFCCSSLESLTIPDGVTDIGQYAFCYCGELESVRIPGEMVNIGDFAFAYCNSIEDITYAGTKAQWDAINKGQCWNESTNAIVCCTDGDIGK